MHTVRSQVVGVDSKGAACETGLQNYVSKNESRQVSDYHMERFYIIGAMGEMDSIRIDSHSKLQLVWWPRFTVGIVFVALPSDAEWENKFGLHIFFLNP